MGEEEAKEPAEGKDAKPEEQPAEEADNEAGAEAGEEKDGKDKKEDEGKPGSGKGGVSGLLKKHKLIFIPAFAAIAVLLVFAFTTGMFNIFSSGASGPESEIRGIVSVHPMVRAYKASFPGAYTDISAFRLEDSDFIKGQLQGDCNITNRTRGDVYKVRVSDINASTYLQAWVDTVRGIICVVEKDLEGNITNKCTSHAYAKCYGNSIFWFNSCNLTEEVKERCPGNCRDGRCFPLCINESEEGNFTDNIACCRGLVSVPKYTMTFGDTCSMPAAGTFVCTRCDDAVCGPGENKCNCPQDCNVTCTDSDSGKNYNVQGKVTFGTHEFWDTCQTSPPSGQLIQPNQTAVSNQPVPNLTEYYCESNAVKYEIHPCANDSACLYGKCLNMTCVKEGEMGEKYPGHVCCPGSDAVDAKFMEGSACKAFGTMFVCIKCGNGACGRGENFCNCPADCAAA